MDSAVFDTWQPGKGSSINTSESNEAWAKSNMYVTEIHSCNSCRMSSALASNAARGALGHASLFVRIASVIPWPSSRVSQHGYNARCIQTSVRSWVLLWSPRRVIHASPSSGRPNVLIGIQSPVHLYVLQNRIVSLYRLYLECMYSDLDWGRFETNFVTSASSPRPWKD